MPRIFEVSPTEGESDCASDLTTAILELACRVDIATVSSKKGRPTDSELAKTALEISKLDDKVSNWEYVQGS